MNRTDENQIASQKYRDRRQVASISRASVFVVILLTVELNSHNRESISGFLWKHESIDTMNQSALLYSSFFQDCFHGRESYISAPTNRSFSMQYEYFVFLLKLHLHEVPAGGIADYGCQASRYLIKIPVNRDIDVRANRPDGIASLRKTECIYYKPERMRF